MEYRVTLQDGGERWLLNKGVTFKDAAGRPQYMTGACVDVGERKRAELALRSLNETLEERVAERTAELDAAHQQILEEIREREALSEGNSGRRRRWRLLANRLAVSPTTSTIFYRSSAATFSFCRGTTQAMNRAERRIQNALTGVSRGSKLASQLLAFGRRQPLEPKVVNLGRYLRGLDEMLLSRDCAGNERAERRIQNALTGVSRGSKLASQLLAFGRRQPLEPKVVNLGRYLRGLDEMLRRAIGEEIELETIACGGLWNACVDVAELENAILNLAINARDAMKGYGKLTIEAGNAWLDDQYAARHPDVTPGQYVMIAVSDTGSGIAPDIIDHVFEPFFTTKREREGTGLGLSMVYGFVKQSGGHAKIHSEPGQGTTVRLYLPRTRQEEDIVIPTEAGPIAGGTETILVVEDDEGVRSTVVDMLTDLGYRVLKAKDAQSALVVIESGIPIDVLFTDVVMPGPLRSTELANTRRDRLPAITVLFTSGYTDNAIVHGGRLDEGTDLLSKPYTREALARKVRQVLSDQMRKDGASRTVQPMNRQDQQRAFEAASCSRGRGRTLHPHRYRRLP